MCTLLQISWVAHPCPIFGHRWSIYSYGVSFSTRSVHGYTSMFSSTNWPASTAAFAIVITGIRLRIRSCKQFFFPNLTHGYVSGPTSKKTCNSYCRKHHWSRSTICVPLRFHAPAVYVRLHNNEKPDKNTRMPFRHFWQFFLRMLLKAETQNMYKSNSHSVNRSVYLIFQ